jgi:hypothetical protein
MKAAIDFPLDKGRLRRDRCRECNAEYLRQWRATRGVHAPSCQPDYIQDKVAAWRSRNGHKRRAHKIVETAVRDGSLIPEPCQVCGSRAAEAHHPDHRDALTIAWLCRAHHQMADSGRIQVRVRDYFTDMVGREVEPIQATGAKPVPSWLAESKAIIAERIAERERRCRRGDA